MFFSHQKNCNGKKESPLDGKTMRKNNLLNNNNNKNTYVTKMKG